MKCYGALGFFILFAMMLFNNSTSAAGRQWCGADVLCQACQRQAFQKWRSVNCWASGKSTSEQIACSKAMSAWFDNAKATCVNATSPSRQPASEPSQADYELEKSILDKALEAANNIATECHSLAEKFKTFKDWAEEQSKELYDGATRKIDECMSK